MLPGGSVWHRGSLWRVSAAWMVSAAFRVSVAWRVSAAWSVSVAWRVSHHHHINLLSFHFCDFRHNDKKKNIKNYKQ